MLLEKPVIATNYGGNTDFLNAENGFPVRAQITTLIKDFGPYPKDSLWGDPDIEQAAHCMRSVTERTAEAANIAKRAKADAERLFSPERIGTLMKDRLQYLAQFYC